MNETLIESTILLPELRGTSKDAVLEEMLDGLVAAGALGAGVRASVLKHVHEREEQGSTGLGNGVAVPHVKATQVAQIVIAVGIAKQGIPFDAIDGRPVHILFLVLGPEGGLPEEHLQVLRWVSTLARNSDFRRFAVNVSDQSELRDLLLEMTA